MQNPIPRPSFYPLLDPKCPLFGTIYPYLRVQGGSWEGNPQKELLWGLWVLTILDLLGFRAIGFEDVGLDREISGLCTCPGILTSQMQHSSPKYLNSPGRQCPYP